MFQFKKDLSIIKKSKKSEQEKIQIPIKHISNIFQTSDGRYKIATRLTPVNGELLSDDELEAVFEAINGALNTFDGRLGIYIQSERVDIESNLMNIERKKQKLNSELKIEILEHSKDHLEKVRSKSRNVLNFYVVFETKQDKYSIAESVLVDAADNFRNELDGGNIYCAKLSDHEFKATLYERMNPETSLVEPYQEDWGTYEITPKDIKRNSDGRHLEIDNRIYRFYYISRFPKFVDEFRWLKRLLKVSGDINIAFTLNPKDKSNVLKGLSNAVREVGSKAIDTRLPENVRQEYENQRDSAKKLIENIGNANSNLYDTNISISISAKNMDELNTLSVRLRAAISSSMCQTSEIRNKGLDPFWVTLPILYDCKITKDYVWNLTSADIASLIPFDSSELMENKGTLIGDNVTSNGIIILDMLDKKKYNNGHLAIVADSGSGKTFFIMLDAIRHYPYVDYIIMFDVKGDFFFPWGKRYDFTPTSGIITNPFHIRNAIISTNNEYENGTVNIAGALANKIMDTIVFFKWIIPDMTPYEEALLEEDIRDCYKEVELTFESESLPEKFPTFDTLEVVMKRKIDNDKKSKKERESRIDMLASFNPYIHGSYAFMFNGQTNWDYEPFTVFGINNVPKAVQNCLYELLLKDTWGFCKKDGTMNPTKKRVYVDEAHKFADKKNPQTLEFLSSDFIKQGRGFGLNVVTATQGMADYLTIEKYGQAIVDNSFFKVFFRVGETDKKVIKELYDFSDKEMKVISPKGKNSSKGKGIFIAGNQRVEFQVRASKWELEVIDPIQFEDIYKVKSRYRR